MVNPQIAVNDGIAKENNLIHIEDCAHSLGARSADQPIGATGDFAIFSFSKNMISPAGGLLQCNAHRWLKKVQTQYNKIHNSRLKVCLLNIDLFSFQYQLMIIKRIFESLNISFKSNFLLKGIPFLLSLLTRSLRMIFNVNTYHGSFFEICEEDIEKTFEDFDLRMTHYQNMVISKRLKVLNGWNETRRGIARRLNSIIPHLFQENDGQHFIYTNYVLCVNAKDKILAEARKANIHFNETWPAEGKCWARQMTERIEGIKNHMLLLSISPFWSEKEIQKIEDFLRSKRSFFLQSLDEQG
jgi:dTDP-4-amino-4,6-dideoxygalactose transaminase